MFRIIRLILYFRLIGNCIALDPEIIEIEDHILYGVINCQYYFLVFAVEPHKVFCQQIKQLQRQS
ncbi:unnamed protein product [Paramecium primaurelia]|uniref:Secreted protein n=1 Tax=Paramecium primaurelia TaxID=5886 RepID=A0A8S1K450_PARPR|nr:unnamed protein product [Paramecium primaurelia]